MYMIKIGTMYLTADGTLSARQADALRVDLDNHPERPRAVRLTPHGTGKYSRPDTLNAPNVDDPSPF